MYEFTKRKSKFSKHVRYFSKLCKVSKLEKIRNHELIILIIFFGSIP